jgi:hypothetical protein
MSDYTAAEIEAAVTALTEAEDGEWYDEYEGGIWEAISDNDKSAPKTVSLRGEHVPVTRVDGKPGAEGGGEEIYVVVQVGDQFFEMPGFYGSEAGETWDGDLYEVHPEEKTITVYTSKK